MSKRSKLACGATLLFVILTTFVVLKTPSRQVNEIHELEGGTRIRLLKVGYGKSHSLDETVFPLVRRILPWKWQNELGMANRFEASETHRSLGVWLETWGDSIANYTTVLVDDHGMESRMVAASKPFRRHDDSRLRFYSFTVFPRGSTNVTIRYCRKNTREVLAEITFPNPAPVIVTNWTAKPFPVRSTVGDLEFSLTNLLVGVRFPDGLRSTPGEDSYALAQFEIREKGVLVNNWEPNRFWLHDAAGNLVYRGVTYKTMGSSEAMFVVQHLWSDAGAWRLQTTFQQKGGMLATNEIFTVRGIPLPAMDSVTELNAEAELAGHRVRFVGISSGKGVYSSFRNQQWSSPMLDFEMHLTPLDRRLVVVSVIDDSGTECRRSRSIRSGKKLALAILPNAGATKVDVTFALPRSVEVEFVAMPKIEMFENE